VKRVLNGGVMSSGLSTVYRFKRTFKIFAFTFIVSIAGFIVELSIQVIAPSIILLTDILHWSIDLTLEAVFILVVYLASRISKRFYWSAIILEEVIIILAIIIVFTIYGLFFIDYLSNVAVAGRVSTTDMFSTIGTIAGFIDTLIVYLILRRGYHMYRLEILNIEKTHSLIDLVASTMSTLGIVFTVYTRSLAIELLFTFITMLFVAHSLIEILVDITLTLTGRNVDHALKAEILSILTQRFQDVEFKNVDVRKTGSIYIISVDILVDPDKTIREVHKLRSLITRQVQSLTPHLSHVDVRFYPKFTSKHRVVKPRKRRWFKK